MKTSSRRVVQIAGTIATSCSMRYAWRVVMWAFSISACEVERPILTDAGEADRALFESTCAEVEECCGVEAPGCYEGVADGAEAIARSFRLATSWGVEAERDAACPLVQGSAWLASTCPLDEACVAPCKPYVGVVEEGGQCHRVNEIDDCAQGLLCFAATGEGDTWMRLDVGVCADPCNRVGQTCEGIEFPNYGLYLAHEDFSPCGPLAHCGPEGVCVPAKQIGEPCEVTKQCAQGHICDEATSTCMREAGTTSLEQACELLVDSRW